MHASFITSHVLIKRAYINRITNYSCKLIDKIFTRVYVLKLSVINGIWQLNQLTKENAKLEDWPIVCDDDKDMVRLIKLQMVSTWYHQKEKKFCHLPWIRHNAKLF